jgi:hypothetical protein
VHPSLPHHTRHMSNRVWEIRIWIQRDETFNIFIYKNRKMLLFGDLNWKISSPDAAKRFAGK